MKTPGLYTMVVGSNKPTENMCHSLIVNRSYDQNDFVQQIAVEESTYGVYMRYCSDTSWSSWKKFSMDGHSHAASDITSGTLPINMGGTGATTVADALTALGAYPSSSFVAGLITGNGEATKTTTLSFTPRLIIVYLVNQPPIKYDSTNEYYIYNFAIGNNYCGCTKGMTVSGNNITLKQTQGTPTDGIFFNLNKNYGQYVYIAFKVT